MVALDNENGRWALNFSTRYVRADSSVIVIAQTDKVYHEINRITGIAFSKMSNGELKS